MSQRENFEFHFFLTLVLTLILIKCVIFLIYKQDSEMFKVKLKNLPPIHYQTKYKSELQQKIETQKDRIKLITEEIYFEQHKKDLHNLCHMKHYLLMNDKGRLGNQLSEYACLYAFTKLYNISTAMSTHQRDYLKQIFPKVSLPVYENTTGCWANTTCQLQNIFTFMNLQKFAFAQCPRKNVFINGYPIVVNLFHQFWNVLMEEEFSFEKVITNQVNEYLNEIKIKHFGIPNDDVQLVGIHVRRGDYEDYVQQRKPHGGYFFSKFYFQNAMNYFRYIYRIIFYINRYDQ